VFAHRRFPQPKFRFLNALRVASFLAVGFITSFSLQASGFSVGCNGQVGDASQLQDSILTASSNGSADEINLVAGCVYTLTAPLHVGADDGQPLVIHGSGATISGNNAIRVLIVDAGAQVTINNLTIAEGSAWVGAGITNSGTLSMNDSVFTNNSASRFNGGALSNYGEITLTRTLLINNSASGDGGAIYSNGGQVVLNASTVRANTAGGWGGGISIANGSFTVQDSIITGNRGYTGGGFGNGGVASLYNSAVTGNTASSYAGGISNGGILTIENSNISGNITTGRGSSGGGIESDGIYADLTITGSVVSGNAATGDANSGGGIANTSGRVSLTNSVISGNTARSAGGIHNESGTVFIDNTTLSGNVSASSGAAITNLFGTLSITGSRLVNNSDPTHGAFLSNAYSEPVQITGSCITGNSVTAVRNINIANIIATGNWWGSASGPGGVGPGSGDAVSSYVVFSNFLTAPPAGCDPLPVPFVSLIAMQPDVSEGATATFTIIRTLSLPAALRVPFTVSGSAIAADYTLKVNNVPLTESAVVIPAGQTSVQVQVSALDDVLDENDETLTLSLSNSSDYIVSEPARSALITIFDSDTSEVSMMLSSGLPISEAQGEVLLYVTLTSQPSANVTMTLNFDADQLRVNSETDGNAEVTFTPGNWNVAQVIPIVAVDNSDVTGDRTSINTPVVSSGDANYDGIAVEPLTIAIVEDDTNFTCETQTDIPSTECQVLVDLYQSTNGDSWTNNAGWLFAETPCTWYGVTCGGEPAQVTNISLPANNLSGSLPDSLSNLSALNTLLLNDNQLGDHIVALPETLQILNLASNQFTDAVPSLPPSLEVISLDNNLLEGSLPILPDSLTSLSVINNQLTGNIPTLPASLMEFKASNNQFTGSIPVLPALLISFSATGNQLSGIIPTLPDTLNSLAIDSNALTGAVPELPVNLEYVFLQNNQLSGAIPVFPPLLKTLNLANNDLSGQLPPFPASLTELHLSDNALIGVIPSSITATNISSGALFLCGGANDLGSDDTLVNAFISARLVGWSDQNGCLPRVYVVDIVDVTPDPIDRAVDVIDVILSEPINVSTFTFADLWLRRGEPQVPLDSRVTITLQDVATNTYRIRGLADFTGIDGEYYLHINASTFAEESGLSGQNSWQSESWTLQSPGVRIVEYGITVVAEDGATDFFYVRLNAAPTADVIVTIMPDSQTTVTPSSLTFTTANWRFSQTVTITAVDDSAVEGNHTGSIAFNADSADTRYNGIVIAPLIVSITDDDSGDVLCASQTQIPQSECAALIDLYQSTNGGAWSYNSGWNDSLVPCAWYGVTCTGGHVTSIILSRNNLWGTLPASLDRLTALRELDLEYNAISGGIPALPATIERLNLGANLLSGSIPPLPAAADVVVLALNQLTGSIPNPLPNSLRVLALQFNQVSGQIPPLPPELDELSLHHNQLTGSLPALPAALTQMFLLDNQLSGQLPSLPPFLNTLDAQNNQFTGNLPPIPPLLTTLYVQNNQLSGQIPLSITSTQLYSSSMSLCGGANDLGSDNPAVNNFMLANSNYWAPHNGCLQRVTVMQVFNPLSTPVNSVDVQLTESVDPSTFTFTDVSLTRNGVVVSLSNSITVTSLSDSGDYRLSGLSSYTTAPGTYVISVNSGGMVDGAGLAGDSASSASYSWVVLPPTSTPTPTITPPAFGMNLISNGTFSAGLRDWAFSGTTQMISNNALQIAPTTAGGSFYQFVNFGSGGDVYEVTFKAGNRSGTVKTLNLMVRDADWSPLYNCVYVLAAYSPIQYYQMRFDTSEGFIPMVLQGALSGDASMGVLIDDMTMVRRTGITVTTTECTVSPPGNTDLIYDGAFNQGTVNWASFNAALQVVNSGGANGNVMELARWNGTPNGGFYQYNPYSAPANGVLQFNFQMANQSNTSRVINMLVRNPDWTDNHSCFITLPPNTPLTNFTILLKTNTAWSNIVIQGWIYVGDYSGTPPLPFRFDNLNLQFLPASSFSGTTQCPGPVPMPSRDASFTATSTPTLTPSLTASPSATMTPTATATPSLTPTLPATLEITTERTPIETSIATPDTPTYTSEPLTATPSPTATETTLPLAPTDAPLATIEPTSPSPPTQAETESVGG
jgi:hypothetical protein